MASARFRDLDCGVLQWRSVPAIAAVVGRAHARQMDMSSRKQWRSELKRYRTKKLDAPSWLWSSVAALLVIHEQEYLEHCRKYALSVETPDIDA